MPEAPSKARTAKALLAATFAGLVSTMLGVGGGLIMVPLFALMGVLSVKRAAGTSLAVIVVVIAAGLAAQLLRAPHDVQWAAAGLLVAGALGGTFIGKWLHRVTPERVFRILFCTMLLVAALRMLRAIPETVPLLGPALDTADPIHIGFLLIAGLLAGIVAAMFGLGGGIVAVPALIVGFGLFQDQFTAARATSLAMILPTSLLGAVLHWRGGSVDKTLALKVIPVAGVAAIAGVFLAYAVPQTALQTGFGVLLLFAAARLALKSDVKKSVEKGGAC